MFRKLWSLIKRLFTRKESSTPESGPHAPEVPPSVDPVEIPPSTETPKRSYPYYIAARHINDSSKIDSTRREIEKYDAEYFVGELDQLEENPLFMAWLKKNNVKVIAYISTSYEDWRSDANEFPDSVKLGDLDDWEGEWWADIRSPVLHEFLKKRVLRAKAIGCDAIEFDNVDHAINEEDIGVKITFEENLLAIKAMSDLVRAEGMEYFLKNCGTLIQKKPQIVDLCDGCLVEEAVRYNEVYKYMPFVEAKKPIMFIGYKRSKKIDGAQSVRKGGYFRKVWKHYKG